MRLQRIVFTCLLMLLIGTEAAQASGETVVRVNQAGYATDAPKHAVVMTSLATTDFTIMDIAAGKFVLAGKLTASIGSWSESYPNIYALDFSSLTSVARCANPPTLP